MRKIVFRFLGILGLALFLATSVPGPIQAQAEIPKTPAGKVFEAWLTSFNSADAAKMRAFDETYRREPGPPLEGRLRFREVSGGFTLLRIEKSEPSSIVALLQEKSSDTIARLTMTVTSEEPLKLVSSPIEAIPRPADFAIPRMTEEAALAALTAQANEMVKNDRFSGAVLVARNGKILLQKAWGRANRETGAPNTLDTQFRMGSMNKMFTSVATLQLVEAGKLALNDPIGKYLTDYPNKDLASKVTVRHLLTHTGGTGDIFGPEFEQNRLTLREHGDYVKLYGARALTHEPGAEHRYSNYGFVLLGALIEKVSGMSYYEYVRAKVFQPAGMKSTDSLPETEKVANRSMGYMRGESGWVPNTDTLPWRGTSAGGGYTTVGDLLRFAQALESGKLISKAMLAEATKPQAEEYGYGFGIRGEGAAKSYGHGGGAPGMNGDLRVFPQSGYVLVSLANVDPPAASRLLDFYALRMPVDDEAAVQQTLHDACRAYLDGNAERMIELLTEDFTTTDSSGAITTRADDVEAAKKGSIRYEVFENRDMKVRLHGDAAVVTGRTIVKGQAGGDSFDAEFQFTDTLVRSGGRWRVAATHISRIKP